MADVHLPDEAETRARWGGWEWSADNAAALGAMDIVFGECDR